MNRRAKIVLGAVAVTLASLATISTMTVSAHGLAGDSAFATTLAAKLGVSEDKVKEALSSMQSDHQAQMQANFEARLTNLAGEGKITESQKMALLAKHEEMMENRLAWQDLTPEERREKMQAAHEDLRRWAEENDINIQFLMPRSGRFLMKTR